MGSSSHGRIAELALFDRAMSYEVPTAPFPPGQGRKLWLAGPNRSRNVMLRSILAMFVDGAIG